MPNLIAGKLQEDQQNPKKLTIRRFSWSKTNIGFIDLNPPRGSTPRLGHGKRNNASRFRLGIPVIYGRCYSR